MACGLPILGTDVGGIPEIVEPLKTGILCPPGDAAALAHNIRLLTDDALLCSALGRAARQRVVSEFAWEVLAGRYLEVYERSIATVRRTPSAANRRGFAARPQRAGARNGEFSVSVVIPWGKLGGDPRRAVQSALEQRWRPLEVIVVCNNAVHLSRAEEILADQLRQGLSIVDGSACDNANGARNLGAKKARGAWIAYLDSDDWWEPEWLQVVAYRYHQLDGRVDGFYGGIRVVGADGAVVGTVPSQALQSYHTAENYLLSYSCASADTYVLRRELLEAVPWDETLRRHQDYDLFARMVASGARLVSMEEPLVNVDWSRPTPHRAHADCLSVVWPWAGRVQPRYYFRHLKNLLVGAARNRDPAALLIPFAFLNPKIWGWYLRPARR
jgi:hypothetical protein